MDFIIKKINELIEHKGFTILLLSGEDLGDELIWTFGMDLFEEKGLSRTDILIEVYRFLEFTKQNN